MRTLELKINGKQTIINLPKTDLSHKKCRAVLIVDNCVDGFSKENAKGLKGTVRKNKDTFIDTSPLVFIPYSSDTHWFVEESDLFFY